MLRSPRNEKITEVRYYIFLYHHYAILFWPQLLFFFTVTAALWDFCFVFVSLLWSLACFCYLSSTIPSFLQDLTVSFTATAIFSVPTSAYHNYVAMLLVFPFIDHRINTKAEKFSVLKFTVFHYAFAPIFRH